MDARRSVTHEVPHGTLWRQGLRLAESAIEAGIEKPGRWKLGREFREADTREEALEALAA